MIFLDFSVRRIHIVSGQRTFDSENFLHKLFILFCDVFLVIFPVYWRRSPKPRWPVHETGFWHGFFKTLGSISDFYDLIVKNFVLLINLSLFGQNFSCLWKEPIGFEVIGCIDLTQVLFTKFILCISIFNKVNNLNFHT